MSMISELQFHVLVVDDSFIDRKITERLLQKFSCQVTTVDSGYKALEFLETQVEINLIITDYCMPGMTGYDLLKKVKESAALKTIPVVIMSSENVQTRISKCLEEGAEEFLLKPVKMADLIKLKPHMMKTKMKKETENSTKGEITVSKPEIEEDKDSSVTEILPLRQELEEITVSKLEIGEDKESSVIEIMPRQELEEITVSKLEIEEDKESSVTEIMPLRQELEEITVSKPEIEEDKEEESVTEIMPLRQESEEEHETMLSSNKRKSMEEVMKPKFNDITTSV